MSRCKLYSGERVNEEGEGGAVLCLLILRSMWGTLLLPRLEGGALNRVSHFLMRTDVSF